MTEENKQDPNKQLLDLLSHDDVLITADLHIRTRDGSTVARVVLNTPLPGVLGSDNAAQGSLQFNKTFDAILVRPVQMKVHRYISKALKQPRMDDGPSFMDDSSAGGFDLPPPPPSA